MARLLGALCGLCMLALAPSIAYPMQPWLTVTAGYADRGPSAFDGATFEYLGRFSRSFDASLLESGPSFGLGVGADLDQAWALSFDYERLFERTASSGDSPPADVDLPVHQFKVTAWWRPYVRSRVRIGVGAGVGIGVLSGQLISDYEGDPYVGDISEHSLVVDGQVSLEFTPVDHVWIVATAGARHLRFDELDFGYVAMIDPATGAYVPLDYSGWLVRLGVRWELPGRQGP